MKILNKSPIFISGDEVQDVEISSDLKFINLKLTDKKYLNNRGDSNEQRRVKRHPKAA